MGARAQTVEMIELQLDELSCVCRYLNFLCFSGLFEKFPEKF
jgi:hypothetical protein